MARLCNHLSSSVGCPSSLAGLWLNFLIFFLDFYLTVSITQITQTTSHGLPHCLPQQRSSAEPLQTTWSCWDRHPRNPCGDVEKTLSAAQSSSRSWSSRCLSLFFWPFLSVFSWRKVKTTPLVQNKGKQKHCCLAIGLRRGHCPQDQRLLLPFVSAQRVKSLLIYASH